MTFCDKLYNLSFPQWGIWCWTYTKMTKVKSLNKVTREKYTTFQLWSQYLFRQTPSFICVFIFFAHLIPNTLLFLSYHVSYKNPDFGSRMEGTLTSCSQPYSQCHSMCSINICWMNKEREEVLARKLEKRRRKVFEQCESGLQSPSLVPSLWMMHLKFWSNC